MSRERERQAAEWFEAARRSYVEAHQGCAHCAEQHCVFLSLWGRRLEYHCMACDFSASHDDQTGRYYAALGATADTPSVFCILERGGVVS
jgi:hypothetical protein